MEKQVLGLNITFSTALILILAPLLLFSIIPNVYAVSTVINPNGDGSLNEGLPNGNFGGDLLMSVRRTVGQIERSIVEFNMPVNMSIINNATLEIFYVSNVGGGVGDRIDTYNMQEPAASGWTEMGATWNKYDGVINWATAGGDFSTLLRASNTIPVAVGVWISFDVTDMAQSFFANGSATLNFFIKMQIEDAVVRTHEFATRENATHAPRLTINYDDYNESGYVGGLIDSSNLTLSARTSYIYVANVPEPIFINQTFFNILNYTSTMGDAWVSVILYTAPNNAPISSVNPLKAIWTGFSIIENNTFNELIVYSPAITTLEDQYIAIALSSTEPIIINASLTNKTMYTYPVYAPYSIEYLVNSSSQLGVYFLWERILPTVLNQVIPVFVEEFNILAGINALALQTGLPSFLLTGSLFMIMILGTLIILTKYKRESGDGDKLPPVILGSFGFSILAFFTITNMLPFELLIYSVIGIAILISIVISRTFMGGET